MDESWSGFDALPDPLDEQQIMRTFARYTEALDGGDADGWVACFTPEVDYSVRARGADTPMYEASGRAALLAYRRSHPVVGAGVAWQHVVTKVRIGVDATGRRARAHSYWTSIAADPAPTIIGFGVYHDLWERQADGSWLIAARVTEAHSR